MKIQRILKKDENNVIVYLDNGDKLYLTQEVIMMNGLRKNQEISESHFSFLINENKKFHIKQRAFRLLGRRLHSINELRIKLLQKDYEKGIVETVLNELIKSKYLDDYKFSQMFSEEKIKIKLWGKNKIKSELIKKRINPEIINDVLKEKFPHIKVFAVEPELSAVISGGEPGPHPIQGLGAGFIPKNLDTSILDGAIKISKEEAFEYTQRAAKEEGLFIGISSGAALAAVAKKLKDIPKGNKVLAFNYDTGERYLSIEGLF